ncbi:bifunctional DNA primase/polymerase [Mycobacterium intracellulare]|uniref:bifunctional DNA primase/polymerase n=1 Tax=Mycobacterium intracellulare TaxID=1767 RepID=UPI0034D382E5
MTIQPQASVNGQLETPHIPDVSGLDSFHAALAYAKAGLYVLPVKIGKHPGSVVGRDWPQKSTRDPDVVEYFWDLNPDAGIALHTGKSSLIVFDLDVDVVADELDWLRAGLFQSTRGRRGARGHYVFTSSEVFVSGGLTLSDGTSVGEIRSGNTVIIAEPSPHAKADEGGQYLWITKGDVPPLTDEAHAYLTPYGTTRARWSASIEAPDELVTQALADWTANTRPKALDGPVKSISEARSGTRDLTRNALRFAASEARVGFYPLKTVIEKGRAAMHDSYSQRGEPQKFSAHEFGRLVANGVGYALSRSPRDILDEANRDYADDDLAQLCKAFWKSSPQLSDLHRFAQARLVGPWSMLGATLARVVSAIPPHVVLPPIVGSYASLNLFVALVGKSGESKSASMLASADWLTVEPAYEASKPGSGEGLAKCFAYKTKLPNGGGWSQIGKQWSVLAQIPEVDTLTATGSRGGATIMSTLREGWSGERLGQDYAGDDKRIVLQKNRYRLCLVVGVQPLRAGPLFDDADGGTPQRFVWFTAVDDDMPEVEPPEPPTLNLGRWEANPKSFPLSIDADRNRQLADRTDPADYDVLKVPDIASDEIKATQRAIRAGKVEPLDGHRLLVQLKVAAALMALEGGRNKITENDWLRAATVMKMSDRTRRSVLDQINRRKDEQNASRGRYEGVRADVADEIKFNRAIERVAGNIIKVLKRDEFNGQGSRKKVKDKIAHRDRVPYFDDAELWLSENEFIEKAEAENIGGTDGGFVLKLTDQGWRSEPANGS